MKEEIYISSVDIQQVLIVISAALVSFPHIKFDEAPRNNHRKLANIFLKTSQLKAPIKKKMLLTGTMAYCLSRLTWFRN